MIRTYCLILLLLMVGACNTPDFPIQYDGEMPSISALKETYRNKINGGGKLNFAQIIRSKFIHEFYAINDQLIVYILCTLKFCEFQKFGISN